MYIKNIVDHTEATKLWILLQLIWYKGLFLNEKPQKLVNMEIWKN